MENELLLHKDKRPIGSSYLVIYLLIKSFTRKSCGGDIREQTMMASVHTAAHIFILLTYFNIQSNLIVFLCHLRLYQKQGYYSELKLKP